MAVDTINPTAKVLEPVAGAIVSKNSTVSIKRHVWDNAAISKVEYLVNGNIACSSDIASEANGMRSSLLPFNLCNFKTGRKPAEYSITIRVFDGSGRVYESKAVIVEAI